MNFIGNDKQFLHRMEEWSELMNQLTKHMTDEQKRALVIDPGKLSSSFSFIFSLLLKISIIFAVMNMASPLPDT